MFSQLSGNYVGVTTSQGNDFTACASKDNDECKVIIAKSANSGTINVNLNNQPFNGQDIRIDLYKIQQMKMMDWNSSPVLVLHQQQILVLLSIMLC